MTDKKINDFELEIDHLSLKVHLKGNLTEKLEHLFILFFFI